MTPSLAWLRPPRIAATLLLGLVLLGSLGGCASQQDAATRVIAEAEQTLQALKGDAQRVVPEQYAAAEQALAQLRTQLEQRDFVSVLAGLPAITSQLGALQDAATARRAEIEAAIARARADWGPLSIEVPTSLDALQRRIDELAAAGKLPPGLDRDALTRARETLSQARSAWADALESFAQGRLPEAVEGARSSREALDQLRAELGQQVT